MVARRGMTHGLRSRAGQLDGRRQALQREQFPVVTIARTTTRGSTSQHPGGNRCKLSRGFVTSGSDTETDVGVLVRPMPVRVRSCRAGFDQAVPGSRNSGTNGQRKVAGLAMA